MDEAIRQHIRKHYNLPIGERRAEEIKINLGSHYPGRVKGRTMDVKGRDLVGGFPEERCPHSRTTFGRPARLGDDHCRDGANLSRADSPELAADIVDTGIVITGGGGLLRGLDRLLGTETQLPVAVAKDPMSCVALGVGRVLDELELLKKVAMPA
jgi:rod shape-determining protein MreB